MLRQAESFGCEVLTQASVERLDLAGPTKTVVVEDEGTFTADAVIIATGAHVGSRVGDAVQGARHLLLRHL